MTLKVTDNQSGRRLAILAIAELLVVNSVD